MPTMLDAIASEHEQAEAIINKFGELLSPAFAEPAKQAYISEYYSTTQAWCDRVFEEAAGILSFDQDYGEIQRYIQFLMGQHWTGTPRPVYKMKPVVNRLMKYLWELVSYMTDLRLNINVT